MLIQTFKRTKSWSITGKKKGRKEPGREERKEAAVRKLGTDKRHTTAGSEFEKVEIAELEFGSWPHCPCFAVWSGALEASVCALDVIDAKSAR